MKRMRSVLAMFVAVIIATMSVTPVFAAEDATVDVVESGELTSDKGADVMPLGSGSYTIGDPGERYVEVFRYSSGYSGPITITVENFNPILYQVDIMANGKQGLLFQEDNWMKAECKKAYIPSAHGGAVVSLQVRIKPRAQLITSDRAFTVGVSW